MLDKALISVISGTGGNGAVSGRRENFVPEGGPDGGDGGSGGSVFLRCDAGLSTLSRFRRSRKHVAAGGTRGEGRKKHGRDGKDIDVMVPEGTEVWHIANGETRLFDLTKDGQRVPVARGGRGGRGNTHFTTSTNRFSLLAEQGEEGQHIELRLELKLLADVGIIGVPNAGKSSLLRAVSAARPRVADYPFTTLEPFLGVVEHRQRSFVMVDIPGLVEGAHSGKGLGDEFLRHVQRTRVLLHLLDGTTEDLASEYRKIRSELSLFDKSLAEKREVVVVNKVDISGVQERCPGLPERLGVAVGDVSCVSAVAGSGIDEMLDCVIGLLADDRQTVGVAEETMDAETIPVLRPSRLDRRIEVHKRNSGYVVEAPTAERIAALVDSSNWHAVLQLREQLRKLGVAAALDRAGVGPGDTVRIGKLELTWN